MDKLNYNSILLDVADIIRRITGNKNLKIDPCFTANDIKNWDSLRHVMIINEIESRYAIQFDLSEMLEMNSVDDICNAVIRKQNLS
jgi:acyl carrier protein